MELKYPRCQNLFQSGKVGRTSRILLCRADTRYKPLDDWLGNLKTFDIYPYKEYPGDVKEAAWLPDKNVAEVWQRFVTAENQDSQKKKTKSHRAGK